MRLALAPIETGAAKQSSATLRPCLIPIEIDAERPQKDEPARGQGRTIR
jgi:hypothetical protein